MLADCRDYGLDLGAVLDRDGDPIVRWRDEDGEWREHSFHTEREPLLIDLHSLKTALKLLKRRA